MEKFHEIKAGWFGDIELVLELLKFSSEPKVQVQVQVAGHFEELV